MISSKGFPELVMSSSRDGTVGKAGDCGRSSAACAVGVALVGNVEVDAAATAPSTAAEGTSVCRAAVVVASVAAAAVVSGTVDGSVTGTSGVFPLHDVQDS